jgi:hypothetical protein
MLEKYPKTSAGECLHDAQRRLAGVFWAGNLGSGHCTGEMGLDTRVPRAQRALLFRFSSARWALHGQNLSQRQIFGFHENIIRHRQLERWSILLSRLLDCARLSKIGNDSDLGIAG